MKPTRQPNRVIQKTVAQSATIQGAVKQSAVIQSAIIQGAIALLMVIVSIMTNMLNLSAASYGFDYKFIINGSASRDPDTYTTSSSDSIQAKTPTLNNGVLYSSDISTLTEADSTTYKTELSSTTQRMIKQTTWRDDFNDSLSNWDSLSDLFTYEVKEYDGSKYVELSVKDFSNGLDLADLFDMSDSDVLELNTGSQHGYTVQVLSREDGNYSIGLLPSVSYPGQFEALVGDSVVVVIKSYNNQSCPTLSISSEALAGSINNILAQSEIMDNSTLENSSNGFIDGLVPVDIDSALADYENDIGTNNEDMLGDILSPIDFANTGDTQNDIGEDMFGNNRMEQYGSGYDSYLDVVAETNSGIENYSQVESNTDVTRVNSTTGAIEGSSGAAGVTVYYNGEKYQLSSVPDGYYLVAREDGSGVFDMYKKELDLSGLSFGTSWGIAERPTGDSLKKLANVETSGNSLLKNISLQMSANIDTLSDDTVNTFYTKPLPQRFNTIQQSDRIVTIHGSYNWIISLCFLGAALLVSLWYFISLQRYVSNRLKELKKMALIKDSELTSEIDAVDVQAMTL